MNDLDEAFQSLQREINTSVRPFSLADVERRARRMRTHQILASAAAAVAVLGIGGGTWAAVRSTPPAVVPASPPPTSTSPSATASTTEQSTSSPAVQGSTAIGLPPHTTADAIGEAIAYLGGKTSVPLVAPKSVPDTWGKSAVLSATARASESMYEVDLYRCAPALPLNDPGISNVTCSGNAQFYGFFGGQTEPSASAAQAALPDIVQQATATGSCQGTVAPSSTTLSFSGGITATALTCTGSQNPVLVKWSQQGWNIVEDFGLTGANNWQSTARTLANKLSSRSLPAASGLVAVQTAGDGDHTELGWTVGSNVYTAYNDHSTSDAVDLAASMSAQTG